MNYLAQRAASFRLGINHGVEWSKYQWASLRDNQKLSYSMVLKFGNLELFRKKPQINQFRSFLVASLYVQSQRECFEADAK